MRARFTDSIASTEGWSYGAGTEVLVAGDRYGEKEVPASIGEKWLASGLLEPLSAAMSTATPRTLETAVIPRPPRAASRR